MVDLYDPFKGCWDRYDRAIAHRQEALALWNDFLGNEDAYQVSVYVDEEREGVGRGVIRVWQSEEFPTLLPILMGEYFYQLRASLDHAVYVTAVLDNRWQDPPPGAATLQFPICDTPESWKRQAYRVEPLKQRHREWIEQVQPYRGANEGEPELIDPAVRGIYWINHLARLDRHRELRVVGAYLAESDPLITSDRLGAVVSVAPMVEEVFVEGGEDGAVIAEFSITPWALGDKVEANPQAALDVELRDFVLGRHPESKWLYLPMGERLFVMETLIHSEVGRLEYDCIRRTRSEFVDTTWEGFKHPPDL
jgi:hypothetical protein